MTIGTQRLVLRPLTKATPRQVAWLRDPEVTRFSEQRHREHTLSSQLRFVGSFAGRSHLWAICRLDSGEHIGNLTAVVDEPNNVAEVGILIGDKASWGKRYGLEAWIGACDWLLSKTGGDVRKLEAGCMGSNSAMKAILRKSKFSQEGERLSHFMLDGFATGMLLYGRFQ